MHLLVIAPIGLDTDTESTPDYDARNVDLARRIRAGDTDAREEMIQFNRRLAMEAANQWTRHRDRRRDRINKLSRAEAEQAAMFGLMRAVDGFDTDLGYKFSTYADKAIFHEIIRAAQGNKPRTDHRIVSLSAVVGHQHGNREPLTVGETLVNPKAPEPSAQAERNDEAAALMRLMRRLKPLYRKILVVRYGLDGRPPCTLVEIAQARGRSVESIRQIEDLAIRELKRLAGQ